MSNLTTRGGFPILLGEANDIFVLDWSLRLRRPVQERGLRIKQFCEYWRETYPHWAESLPQVLWRLKHKRVNLAGHATIEDVVKKNTAGPQGATLTLQEMAQLYAPEEPPKSRPWAGFTITAPDTCCGDPPILG